MKVLFFIEPLIEMGRPYWKEGWANSVASNMIETLEKSGMSFEFCIAFSKPISQRFKPINGVKEVVFTQEELLAGDEWNYLDLSISWYQGNYSDEQLNYYIALVKNKFQEFIPDVVITFTQVPYIAKAFPAALILHTELSLFSRSPYPVSYFLDPCGMYSNAFIAKYKGYLEKYKINQQQKERLESLKADIQQLILNKCPFNQYMLSQKEKFEYIILLPLQLSGTYTFDGLCDFKSQYDFLIYVLNNVPQNVGVVVTTHPEYDVLDLDTVQYLTSQYSNFIYHDSFKKFTAISQYLIAYVDAVVSVGSSVGLQTLLWDKKLIVIGSSHLDCIADANTLDDLSEVLADPVKDKSAIAYWIITRYTIPSTHFFNSEWLSHCIVKMVEKHKTKALPYEYYYPLDDEERVFDYLINQLDRNIPYFSSDLPLHMLKELVKRYDLISGGYQANLYIDIGKGFSGEWLLSKKISGTENYLEFELKNFEIKRLRIDPSNNAVCLNLQNIIVFDDKDNKYQITEWETNAFIDMNNILVFTTDNPSIIIDVSKISNIRRISVNLQYVEIGMELYKHLPKYVCKFQTSLAKFFKDIYLKKIVIFGTGSTGCKIYANIPLKVDYFVDNDPQKWGTKFQGMDVKNPSQLLKEEKSSLAIIIASQYYKEISVQLTDMGLEENIHFWNGFKMFKQQLI